ncbi:hypothetical protein KDK_78480 [Dictyobacter kobayashii]|uniref:Uncharacterized protein n=1 Tax=Dictyobacter kobayashii TaxID=2014872 RepID=A0A402AY82_9CHLR|nr:hypothetical protein KDK_78480 [Dictyobacter kobayashii]
MISSVYETILNYKSIIFNIFDIKYDIKCFTWYRRVKMSMSKYMLMLLKGLSRRDEASIECYR